MKQIDQIQIAPDFSYIIEQGVIYPITNLFDSDGEETDDHELAVSGVAGIEGYWVSFVIFKKDIVSLN